MLLLIQNLDQFLSKAYSLGNIHLRKDLVFYIQLVVKEMGFDLADTIGFGDSMNDLEMMETVGYSVCMGNGSDSLKEICDYVCPPIEKDGLARAFETLGLA